MRTIFFAILFLTLCTSAYAQTNTSERVLRVSTESEQGVLVEFPDEGQQRPSLKAPLLELRLPEGSTLSLRKLGEGIIRGRHDEKANTTTLVGDYSVKIMKGEQTVAYVTAEEASFEILRSGQ